mmetsp:Transcript_3238/g.14665  ORF Transcript_3238/g.14665 Transcript_3238/m.14665 type:complete len:209 (+) Transcript_3238:2465-3091(+)
MPPPISICPSRRIEPEPCEFEPPIIRGMPPSPVPTMPPIPYPSPPIEDIGPGPAGGGPRIVLPGASHEGRTLVAMGYPPPFIPIDDIPPDECITEPTGGGAPITPRDPCLPMLASCDGAMEPIPPVLTPADEPLPPFLAAFETSPPPLDEPPPWDPTVPEEFAFCGYGCDDLRLGRGGGMCSPVPFFCTLRKYFCAWLRIWMTVLEPT